jgi:hypothetical protein
LAEVKQVTSLLFSPGVLKSAYHLRKEFLVASMPCGDGKLSISPEINEM